MTDTQLEVGSSQPGLAVSPRGPDQYHLAGDGITVAYFPGGSGPLVAGRGRLRLEYQDAERSQSFHDADVRTVDVADLGTIVSVTLVISVDTASTTLSLLVPNVVLPEQQSSVDIHTEAITTLHRSAAQ